MSGYPSSRTYGTQCKLQLKALSSPLGIESSCPRHAALCDEELGLTKPSNDVQLSVATALRCLAALQLPEGPECGGRAVIKHAPDGQMRLVLFRLGVLTCLVEKNTATPACLGQQWKHWLASLFCWPLC